MERCRVCGQSFKEQKVLIGDKEKTFYFPSCDCGAKQKEEKEKKEKQDQKIALLKKIIPPRFFHASFEAAKEINPEIVKKAWDWVKLLEYTPMEQLKGLFLFGGYGVGKTFLACCIAKEILLSTSFEVEFFSVPEMLERMRREQGRIRGSLIDNLIVDRGDKITKKQVLILDDIGQERVTDWVAEQVFILINNRYENYLPTIFTSNCNSAELERNLGGAIISRIFEMCDILKLMGEDLRKKIGSKR